MHGREQTGRGENAGAYFNLPARPFEKDRIYLLKKQYGWEKSKIIGTTIFLHIFHGYEGNQGRSATKPAVAM